MIRAALVPLVLAACAPTGRPPPPRVVPGSTEALQGVVVTEGSLASRVVTDDADLVVFYAAEHRGSLGPCGCPKEPRGGLPRLAAYLEAAQAANPQTPTLLLHAGYFLDDSIGLGGDLRADVPLVNRWMLQGLAALPWTALNVASPDLPGLDDLGSEAEGLPLVSAAVSGPAGLTTWIRTRAGDLPVAITGITNPRGTFLQPEGWSVADPLDGATEALAQGARAEDLVILLAWDAVDAARELARRHRGVDLVVEAAHHHESVPPFQVGEAVWVKVHHETQRLGELRLWIRDGRVVRALDRQVDLDPDIPGEPGLETLLQASRTEITARQRELWAR